MDQLTELKLNSDGLSLLRPHHKLVGSTSVADITRAMAGIELDGQKPVVSNNRQMVCPICKLFFDVGIPGSDIYYCMHLDIHRRKLIPPPSSTPETIISGFETLKL